MHKNGMHFNWIQTLFLAFKLIFSILIKVNIKINLHQIFQSITLGVLPVMNLKFEALGRMTQLAHNTGATLKSNFNLDSVANS